MWLPSCRELRDSPAESGALPTGTVRQGSVPLDVPHIPFVRDLLDTSFAPRTTLQFAGDKHFLAVRTLVQTRWRLCRPGGRGGLGVGVGYEPSESLKWSHCHVSDRNDPVLRLPLVYPGSGRSLTLFADADPIRHSRISDIRSAGRFLVNIDRNGMVGLLPTLVAMFKRRGRIGYALAHNSVYCQQSHNHSLPNINTENPQNSLPRPTTPLRPSEGE